MSTRFLLSSIMILLLAGAVVFFADERLNNNLLYDNTEVADTSVVKIEKSALQGKSIHEWWGVEIAVRSGNGEYTIASYYPDRQGSFSRTKLRRNPQQVAALNDVKGTENLAFTISLPFQHEEWQSVTFRADSPTFQSAEFGADDKGYYAQIDGACLRPAFTSVPHTGGDPTATCVDRGSDPLDDSIIYDKEPSQIFIRTGNSRFLRATVTVRTTAGSRTVRLGYDNKPVQAVMQNPGNLKGGYTVTVRMANGRVLHGSGKRVTAFNPLIFQLIHDGINSAEVFIEQNVYPFKIEDWRSIPLGRTP